MAVITPTPKTQFLRADGTPLVGGKVFTYIAGTTTPQSTYTDSTGSTVNSNPVILDSRGEANIWLGEATYKFELTDADDVEIWTVDYISAPTASVSPVLSGNVTISTDSTGAALKITQTGTGNVLTVQDSVDPDVTPFVINAEGQVGIGTISPQAAIDIDNNGTIQFSASGAARTIISADSSNSIIDVQDARNFVVKTDATTVITANTSDVTTTVPVVLPSAPTTTLQAATKGYVDGLTGSTAGIISAFAGTSAPSGWLSCNGSAVSRTTYAALFAAIGTTWGAGDGSTTFNVPDLRGMFLRGTGTNATGSSSGAVGPSVGTYAADTYLNHNHTASVTDPGHTHNYTQPSIVGTLAGTSPVSNALSVATAATSSAVTGISVTVATSTTGGTETKPKNYGILYIIKT